MYRDIEWFMKDHWFYVLIEIVPYSIKVRKTYFFLLLLFHRVISLSSNNRKYKYSNDKEITL